MHGRDPAALRRAIERVVLLTWAAAAPRLAAAAAAGLNSHGLRYSSQWAGQFELVGVDLMLDSELSVWLMEMNASPSLATEEAAGTPWPERDLPTKRAMLRDMLRPRTQMRPNHTAVFHLLLEATRSSAVLNSRRWCVAFSRLADVLPEAEGGATPPPEALLARLYLENGGRAPPLALRPAAGEDGAGASCRRRWRLGGCLACPLWGEIGEIWRSAAEVRRAGGFAPLAPSEDAEWSAAVERAARVADAVGAAEERDAETSAGSEAAKLEAAEGSAADAARAGEALPSALWQQQLLREWWRRRPAEGSCADGRGGRECIRATWDAMLCDPRGATRHPPK